MVAAVGQLLLDKIPAGLPAPPWTVDLISCVERCAISPGRDSVLPLPAQEVTIGWQQDDGGGDSGVFVRCGLAGHCFEPMTETLSACWCPFLVSCARPPEWALDMPPVTRLSPVRGTMGRPVQAGYGDIRRGMTHDRASAASPLPVVDITAGPCTYLAEEPDRADALSVLFNASGKVLGIRVGDSFKRVRKVYQGIRMEEGDSVTTSMTGLKLAVDQPNLIRLATMG